MSNSTEEDGYTYFPPITIGGPSGDYFVDAPVQSARWAEYSVLSVCNGTGGVASIAVSPSPKPPTVKFDGSVTASNDVQIQGQVYRVGIDTTIPIITEFARMPNNSQKRLFVRIDTGNNTSAYVTLRFREKNITTVPGQSHEVHPDHMHKLNQARAEKIRERLSELGIPEFAQEGA